MKNPPFLKWLGRLPANFMDTIATDAADLIDGKPPQATAAATPAPAAAPAASPSPPFRGPQVRDSINRIFDPNKFAVDGSGRPRYDSMRRFINKNAGRKPYKVTSQTTGAPAKPDPVPPPAADPAAAPTPPAAGEPSTLHVPGTPAAAPQLSAEAAAAETVESCIGIIQTALIMLGEDEGILTDTEKMLLRGPLQRTLTKYQVGELPCEADLALALAGVIIARLGKPKTQTRIEKIKMWFAGKIAEFRGNRMAQRVAEVTAPTTTAAP